MAKKKQVPLVLSEEEGEAFWYDGSLVLFRATNAQTGGVFSMIELEAPRDTETPLHVHEREAETFVVMAGELDVVVAGETFMARAGHMVVSPAGTEHAFRVATSFARLMFVYTPGTDAETFFRAVGDPAGYRGLPPPAPIDAERGQSAAGKAHMKVIGPARF